MVVFLNFENPSQSIGDDMLLSNGDTNLFDAVILIFWDDFLCHVPQKLWIYCCHLFIFISWWSFAW